MACVNVTSAFGIIVRRAALRERAVAWDKVLSALEAQGPLDANDDIASFGPHFGQEALDTLVRRLSELGLKYFDDFFEFRGDYPKWCRFKACYVHKE